MIDAKTEAQLRMTLETIRAQELGMHEEAEPTFPNGPDLKINWDGLESLASRQTPVTKGAHWIENLPDWALAFVVMLAPLMALLGIKLGMAFLPEMDLTSPNSWLTLLLIFCLISFSALLTMTYLRSALHPKRGRLIPSSLAVGALMFALMCGLAAVRFDVDARNTINPSEMASFLAETYTIRKTDEGWRKGLIVTLDQITLDEDRVSATLPKNFPMNKDSTVMVHFKNGQTSQITEHISQKSNELTFQLKEGAATDIATVKLSTESQPLPDDVALKLQKILNHK